MFLKPLWVRPIHSLNVRTSSTDRNDCLGLLSGIVTSNERTVAHFTRSHTATCHTLPVGLCGKDSQSGLLDKCLPCHCGRIPTCVLGHSQHRNVLRIDTHTHQYTHTHTPPKDSHNHTHRYTHTQTPTHIHTHPHEHTHGHIHPPTHTHKQTHTYTSTDTHPYKHTHEHTHEHTHTQHTQNHTYTRK